MMDSYMGDELLVETNHEVLAHLESCPDCRIEMAARRELATQLKRSMRGIDEAQIDTVFAGKLRQQLKETALRPTATERIAAIFIRPVSIVAFATLLISFVGIAIWFGSTRQNNSIKHGSNIADAVRGSFSDLAHLAVGDHENCAVKFNLKDIPITLDEAAAKFGSYNKDLDKTVINAIGSAPASDVLAGSEFVESHSCMYENRRFTHIVVRKNGELVSMLVTDTDLPLSNGEIIAAVGTPAKAAGFVIGHHAVFLVSQLSDADNTAFASSLAPAIRSHFEKLGA